MRSTTAASAGSIDLAARRNELKRMLEPANDPPPLLHPNMADLWRAEITRDGELAIDVKGNLAAMLAKASPTDDWERQLALVAGARNQRYLQLWSGAA